METFDAEAAGTVELDPSARDALADPFAKLEHVDSDKRRAAATYTQIAALQEDSTAKHKWVQLPGGRGDSCGMLVCGVLFPDSIASAAVLFGVPARVRMPAWLGGSRPTRRTHATLPPSPCAARARSAPSLPFPLRPLCSPAPPTARTCSARTRTCAACESRRPLSGLCVLVLQG